VPLFSTLKTLHPHRSRTPYHLFFYSTLHHSAAQDFEFILGHCCPFSFLLFVPAISGQMSEPLTTPTQLPFSSF